MKTKLFLFAASLLFLACSNDDKPKPEEQQNTFKIKKISGTFFTGNQYATFYDETGKKTKSISTDNSGNPVLQDDYLYSDTGQIKEFKVTSLPNNVVLITNIYEYNSDDKISKINTISEDGSIETSHFNYDDNLISINYESGGNKKYIFNEDGKLIQTIYFTGQPLNNTITETINYNGELITSLHYEQSYNSDYIEDFIFEYDDKINPLYENFTAYINNYIYNYNKYDLRRYREEFSANVSTTTTFNTTIPGAFSYTDGFTITYNDEGLPMSTVVTKNNNFYKEVTYEYY